MLSIEVVYVFLLFVFFITHVDSSNRDSTGLFGANRRPVIGIFTQPVEPADQTDERYSYIAASYAKAVEGAGGLVVPILYNWSDEKLARVFSQVNGVLLPGGDAILKFSEQFVHAQAVIFKLAKEENDKVTNMP